MNKYTNINDIIQKELHSFGVCNNIPVAVMDTFAAHISIMITQAQETAYEAGVLHGVLQQLYSDQSLTADTDNDEDADYYSDDGLTPEQVAEVYASIEEDEKNFFEDDFDEEF